MRRPVGAFTPTVRLTNVSGLNTGAFWEAVIADFDTGQRDISFRVSCASQRPMKSSLKVMQDYGIRIQVKSFWKKVSQVA